MCGSCERDGIGRRDVLKLTAAGLIATAVGGAPRLARAAEGSPTPLTPDEALSALKKATRTT